MQWQSKKNREIICRSDVLVNLSFKVISYVYRSFIQNKISFTKYCLAHWVSKLPGVLRNPLSVAVPGKLHGSGGHSKSNCLQDRANFHRSRAWQIVIIFNTAVLLILWGRFTNWYYWRLDKLVHPFCVIRNKKSCVLLLVFNTWNPPVISGFHVHMVHNAESAPMSWMLHGVGLNGTVSLYVLCSMGGALCHGSSVDIRGPFY